MPTKQDTVDVKLNSGKWSMRVNSGQWHTAPNYPELEVGKDEVGLFTFNIVGSPGVTFAQEAFVQKKGSSHNKPDFADQFSVHGEGTTELIVFDKNEDKGGGHYPGGKYEYQLQFVGAPPLDPIITNTGCCRAAYHEEVLWSFIGAGVLALLLHALRFWQARRSPVASPSNRTSGKL